MLTFSDFFGYIPVFFDAILHFCVGIGFVQWIHLFATLHHVYGSSYMQRCSSGFIVPTPSGNPVVSRGNLADGGG